MIGRRISALVLAALAMLGVGLVAPTAAQAAPGTITVMTTCRSWSPVWTQFRTNWGTWAARNVNPCVTDGELNGNTAYEPRDVYVGPHWCITYWFVNNGVTSNKLYGQGFSTGYWYSIYPGDGYNGTWKAYVEAWYGGWCP